MAQTTIRKGFFFYFGLLVLILFAGFLVCLVVMMFNPGKTVLWMQYFTDNYVGYVSRTSDNLEINYNNINKIVVDCGWADVSVGCNRTYEKDGIYIVNKAKGFSVAKSAVKFNVEVELDGQTLKVNVSEPKGFLYFSKDIKVVLNKAYFNSSWNLSGLNLAVDADDDCDISFGDKSIETGNKSFSLASVDVKTAKGDIAFNETFGTENVSGKFSVETESGSIFSTKKQMVSTNKYNTVLNTTCDVVLKTTKGNIKFDILNVSGKTVEITNKKGAVYIGKIVAQDTASKKGVQVSCNQGNFTFGEVSCSIDFSKSEDSIISPNINIGELQGDFTLSSTDDSDAPEIYINKISGQLFVSAMKGKVAVNEANGIVNLTSDGSMAVDVVVGKDNNKGVVVLNKSGKVDLKFKGVVGDVDVTSTDNAKVDIEITNVASFDAKVYDAGKTNLLSQDKISVSIAGISIVNKNDFEVRGTSASVGNINIATNGTVSFGLVA